MAKKPTVKQRINEAARIAAKKYKLTQVQVRELLTYWSDEEEAGMRDMDLRKCSAAQMAKLAGEYICDGAAS